MAQSTRRNPPARGGLTYTLVKEFGHWNPIKIYEVGLEGNGPKQGYRAVQYFEKSSDGKFPQSRTVEVVINGSGLSKAREKLLRTYFAECENCLAIRPFYRPDRERAMATRKANELSARPRSEGSITIGSHYPLTSRRRQRPSW